MFSDEIFESCVFFFDSLILVGKRLILLLLELDKAFLELLSVSEFTFDELGV